MSRWVRSHRGQCVPVAFYCWLWFLSCIHVLTCSCVWLFFWGAVGGYVRITGMVKFLPAWLLVRWQNRINKNVALWSQWFQVNERLKRYGTEWEEIIFFHKYHLLMSEFCVFSWCDVQLSKVQFPFTRQIKEKSVMWRPKIGNWWHALTFKNSKKEGGTAVRVNCWLMSCCANYLNCSDMWTWQVWSPFTVSGGTEHLWNLT